MTSSPGLLGEARAKGYGMVRIWTGMSGAAPVGVGSDGGGITELEERDGWVRRELRCDVMQLDYTVQWMTRYPLV